MVTPADIRAHLRLKTDAHDDLIELAIMAVDMHAAMWGVTLPPAQTVMQVGSVVAHYPEIARALRMEGRNG